MIEFKVDTSCCVWPTLVDGIKELMHNHWLESAKNKELMHLAPDWDKYEALDDAGVLMAVSAWENFRVVGYSINIVDYHLHYKGLKVSSNDVLYLSQEHRQGRTGLRLMAATEQAAKDCGAKLHLWHAKEGSPLHRILEAKKRTIQDIIYSVPL